VASRPCRVKLALPDRTGRSSNWTLYASAALGWLGTLGEEAADMDDVHAPARLAAGGIAARLTHRDGPGPVMTAVGRPRPCGNLRHFRAGRELAA
jgi:hypothetical protein